MCGVFGRRPADGAGSEAAAVAALGLFALQHRGQESAGVAVSDGEQLMLYKDLGMIALGPRRAAAAVAPRRPRDRPLPLLDDRLDGLGERPAHVPARARAGRSPSATTATSSTPASCSALLPGGRARLPASTDTELLTALLADEPGADTVDALVRVLPRVRGAYSLVVLDERRVIGVRDPHGFRPLVLGRLPASSAVAGRRRRPGLWARRRRARLGPLVARRRRSTSSARSSCGTSSPGEIVVLEPGRAPRSVRFAEANPALCVFELIYFARPDSYMEGRNLYEARRRMGDGAGARAPGRRRPRDARAGHRCPGRGGLRRGDRASRTARAWSATATPAGRSSSRRRRCASAA